MSPMIRFAPSRILLCNKRLLRPLRPKRAPYSITRRLEDLQKEQPSKLNDAANKPEMNKPDHQSIKKESSSSWLQEYASQVASDITSSVASTSRRLASSAQESAKQWGQSAMEAASKSASRFAEQASKSLQDAAYSAVDSAGRAAQQAGKAVVDGASSAAKATVDTVVSTAKSTVQTGTDAVSKTISEQSSAGLRWFWWWSLAAIAVYGISTTVPKELIRLWLDRKEEKNKDEDSKNKKE